MKTKINILKEHDWNQRGTLWINNNDPADCISIRVLNVMSINDLLVFLGY